MTTLQDRPMLGVTDNMDVTVFCVLSVVAAVVIVYCFVFLPFSSSFFWKEREGEKT